eukprot:NODE_180_length_13923_cov_0.697772.p4 type:complete len:468 gc:universal NODE_180_length_13923_cov_0.697772:8165-9568(+)
MKPEELQLSSETKSLIHDLKENGYHWLHQEVFEKNPLETVENLVPFLPIEALIDGKLNPLYTEHEYLFALFKLGCIKMQRYRKANFLNMDELIDIIDRSKKILVITGAGISVAAGIPDFRGKNGLYSQLKTEYPELTEPQEMFDLHVFKDNPSIFYSFAHKIYPSNFNPTLSHKFILELEKKGKLLKNYTQNIDGLENVAGITKVIQCHGSFEFAYCLKCGLKVKGGTIEKEIFEKVVPFCKKCPKDEDLPAIMKPCITFFHEKLPQTFDDAIEHDVDECDLVIVMGSSLKVAPVAELVHLVRPQVPQVLINRELLRHLRSHFDIHLLGNSDAVVSDICNRLNWNLESSLDSVPPVVSQPNHYIYENGKLEIESQITVTSITESETGNDDGSSIADEGSIEEDELAGLYMDQQDMEDLPPTEAKIRKFEMNVLQEESSEDDNDFNPYKRKKLESPNAEKIIRIPEKL